MTISVTDTALDMEKKAISRCGRRNRIRGCLAWIYGIAFLMSFAGFYVFWYTDTLQDYVLSQLELRNDTKSFDWWQRPPLKIKYRVYIFNYTNVDEFEAGTASKLRVQELGPYSYEETKNRVNVVIHENGTLTYQEKRSYEWVGDKPENDIVIVPNVPLMSAIAYVRDLNFAMRFVTNAILASFQEHSFIHETAGGFLWGYKTQLFEMIKPLMQLQGDISFDNFGILAVKNSTDKNRITMHTRFDNLGMFELVNGKDSRHVWDDERCDKIEGTDGSMFPFHLIEDSTKTLNMYSVELCKSIPFRFSESTTTFGIPSLRYKIEKEAFNYSKEHNRCFCPKVHDSRICPPNGLLNISTCSYGSPLLSSYPHFLHGEKSLLEQIEGLNPRQEDHESFFDIHPRLGVPMAGWSRLQVNVQVRSAVAVPFLGKLKDGMILPLIWFEVGSDEVPEPLLEIFRTTYFTVNAVNMAMQWFTLIVMILSLSALVACLWKYRADQDAVLQRKLSGQNNLLESL